MIKKINFKISKKQDLSTLKAFVKESKYGDETTLKCAFFNLYPGLKNYIKRKKVGEPEFYISDINSIKSFIDNEYATNKVTLRENLNKIQAGWGEKTETYFRLASELFAEKYWPKGEYTACATIWGIYPRFIERRLFQIPALKLEKQFTMIVIAHELLHFAFYNYFLKNYPEYTMNENSFFIWNISEGFNEVVQWHPKWIREFGFGCDIYGGRDEIVKKLQKKYSKLDIIDSKNLIDDLIIEIKKNKKFLLHD
jgi:hypothetical protein